MDIRLNEIEQRLVDGDSSQEDFSMEEEEKNQESFIWEENYVKLILRLLDMNLYKVLLFLGQVWIIS